MPGFVQSICSALANLTRPAVPDPEPRQPAASVKPDCSVCLEDGAKLEMLRPYTRTRHNMAPEEYRTKWNPPRDYPMVAPACPESRRPIAHAIGLGRKKVTEAPVAVAPATKRKRTPAQDQASAPRKRGRPFALGKRQVPSPKF